MSTVNSAEGQGLAITRVFNAPLALVFEIFSKSEHLQNWFGPKGADLHIVKHEFEPGGTYLYNMSGPDGGLMWGKFEYKEIVPKEKIVYISAFSDEEGNIVRAPFSALWPLEIYNTVSFKTVDGGTELTMTGIPYSATEEENAFFESFKSNVQQGYAGMMSVLENYLAEVQV
ncbi:SRPBCC domain-containing protein [Paenibacillus sp. GCM10027627]|uniref:SRPBCC family protein n=1 Tax=unclassified Paenibacillus TaxID=185978 RepID=UPI003624E86E